MIAYRHAGHGRAQFQDDAGRFVPEHRRSATADRSVED
jgi:hypothetical protein